jgi:hypothetical protein
MATFTIKEVERLRYRPTKPAEEFLGDLRTGLGLPDKATAARLAIARSLNEKSGPADLNAEGFERGLAIEGVHLFSEDSDLWSCAIAASIVDPVGDAAYFRSLVEAHWHRGALLLQRDYAEAGKGQVDFIVKLANLVPRGRGSRGGTAGQPGKPVTRAVSVRMLDGVDPWQINAPGGNGLMVVSGKPGSGKSQLVLDLLAQAASQGVRFLFFDLKGEFESNPDNAQQEEKRATFLRQTGAEYVRLITSGLPINPLFKGANEAESAQIAAEIAHFIRCFASQLGANQERTIREAFEELENPDFPALSQGLSDHGEEGVARSIVEKICSFGIFAEHNSAIPIDEWLGTSRIIDLKGLGNDTETKSLVVAFVLNSIMRQLNRNLPIQNGIQPLQMILFVDEAHLLLPKEGKAGLIGSLARQGRSWGFPVWLASQDADAFITKGQHATDFAELADCGVHLSPSTLTESQQKQILGQVVHRRLSEGEGVLRLRGKTTVGKIRQYWRDKGVVTGSPGNP